MAQPENASDSYGPIALILVPTRELGIQVIIYCSLTCHFLKRAFRFTNKLDFTAQPMDYRLFEHWVAKASTSNKKRSKVVVTFASALLAESSTW